MEKKVLKVMKMREKDWRFEKCNGCKSYNPECRSGACIFWMWERKNVEAKEKEIHDTG